MECNTSSSSCSSNSSNGGGGSDDRNIYSPPPPPDGGVPLSSLSSSSSSYTTPNNHHNFSFQQLGLIHQINSKTPPPSTRMPKEVELELCHLVRALIDATPSPWKNEFAWFQGKYKNTLNLHYDRYKRLKNKHGFTKVSKGSVLCL